MPRIQLALFGILLTLGMTVHPNRMRAQQRTPIAPPQPRPSFDLLAFKGSTPDSVRIDLYVAVPYRMLEFVFAGDKYVADYATSMQIEEPETEHVIIDRYKSYTVLESTYEKQQRIATHDERADAEQFSFALSPLRKYTVHLSVRDLSSHNIFDTSFEYQPSVVTARHISDLMVYRQRRGMTVVPSIGDNVTSLTPNSGIFAELYDTPPDSVLGIVAEVASGDADYPTNENIAARSVTWIRTAVSTQRLPQTALFIPLSYSELWLGKYRLRVFVLPTVADTSLQDWRSLEKHSIATSERSIIVTAQRGIPLAAADIDQAIEQLRLIATGTEWDSLTAGESTKEKRDAILEFWRKRNQEARGFRSDDVRPMEVFYSRVQYANEHFASGFQPGWKSDRGLVYISLGPPAYIDSHPYEAMQKPYEIWEYMAPHARYTFVDQYMLGDYRLIGSPPPPGTFIWDH
jgi:GWxTD domain-containing protein